MRLSRFLRRRAWDEERARELEAHLAYEIDDNQARGMAPEEARRQAYLKLGNPTLIREEIWQMNSFVSVEDLGRDIRYGFRQLIRSPVFTATAVLTLALGIGANAALFSVVDSVLLKPLPYPGANRMVLIQEERSTGTVAGPDSWPDYVDWRSESHVFEQMAALWPTSVFLQRADEPPRAMSGAFVSSAFFHLFGVKAMLGRTFGDADQKPGGPAVVVISYGFWENQMHSDPDVVGRAVTLYGRFWDGPKPNISRTMQQFTIIGVLAPGFQFPGREAEVLFPFGQQPAYVTMNRKGYGCFVVGKLRRGVSQEQAQSEMDLLMKRLGREYPQSDKGKAVALSPMLQALVGNQPREELILLLGATGFVLLLACANVAHMALARGIGRQREFAVRAALGAGRTRLARQLLVEHAMLALLGGIIGVAVAVASEQVLVRMYPQHLFRLNAAHLDGSVLLFALGISFLAAVLFGLAPIFGAQRVDLSSALKGGGRGTTRSQGWMLRSALLVTEIALALVVVVGAGLLLRSLWLAMNVNTGFQPDHLLEFTLGSEDLIQHPHVPEAMNFYKDCLNRLRQLPGVESVSAASSAPLSGIGWRSQYAAGSSPPGNQAPWAAIDEVMPDYFRTIGAHLIAGRLFSDSGGSASAPVAIVNEALARTISQQGRVVGTQVSLKYVYPQHNLEIIGVVGDVKQGSLVTSEMPEAYILAPRHPIPFIAAPTIVIRTRVNPASLELPAIRAIHEVDETELLTNISTFNAAIVSGLSTQRFLAFLLSLFGGLVLVLAVVGVSGGMAHMVAQRTQEIGLRMALGAQPQEVLRLVLRRAMLLSAFGVALGIGGALACTRLISNQLFGIKPTDPETFTGAAILVVAAALLASWLPAKKAARVEPLIVLREE